MPAAPAGHLGEPARFCQGFVSVNCLSLAALAPSSRHHEHILFKEWSRQKGLGSRNMGDTESPEAGSRAAAVLFPWTGL